MKYFYIYFLLCLVSWGVYSQRVYENMTYSPLIKTITLHKGTSSLDEPVISLNTRERLYLEFDELIETTRRYEYTLIHCNSDWTQSNLTSDQYLEGFETQPIENFENSFNTLQRYVHYSQTIPSEDMKLTKSGNYIIKVFPEGKPDNVVFTKKMYVVDQQSDLEMEIQPSTLAPLLSTHQEVNVRVKGKGGIFFSNPEQYMKVIVIQNHNDLSAHQLKFRTIIGDKLDYSFYESNQFEATNEFRFFDFTSLRRKSQYVIGFDFLNNQNQVYLKEERLRNHLPYSYDKDLNGEFYIRNEYDNNYSTTSDYALVHFTYPVDLNLEGAYYIVGQMNDWRISTQSQMKFENGKYHLALYLKQGYYNYQIVFKHNNENKLSTTQTEGNFSQTNNKYAVLVYYHNFSDDYDALVGYHSMEYNR